MFDQYQATCRAGRFGVGQLHLYRTAHKWVLNFPIRKHWRDRLQLDTLETGLQRFAAIYAEQGITSASFPAFGMEGDELNWNEVRPLMEAYLDPLPMIVYIHRIDEQQVQRNARTIGAWLNGMPQAITFDKVWRDLIRLVRRKNTLTTGDGMAFTVTQEEKARSRSLSVRSDEDDFYLSESLLSDLWAYIRVAGYCVPDNLPSGLESYAPYLVALFAQLDYVRPVEISTNYRLWQTGLHYVPLVQREAERPGAARDRSASTDERIAILR
jgi:hypothetical protein